LAWTARRSSWSKIVYGDKLVLDRHGAEVERRVVAKLAALSLTDAEDKLPGELSDGMVKRAGIARALVVEPDVLVHDAPTTGGT
jgi:ABC-type transporter Mla maintaining outer membrane lipid asymmetry ATPase subunit MlaF